MLDDLGTLSSSTSRRWCPVSTAHQDARIFFYRDVNCIRDLIMKVNLTLTLTAVRIVMIYLRR